MKISKNILILASILTGSLFLNNCSEKEVLKNVSNTIDNGVILYDKIENKPIKIAVEIPKGKTKEDFLLVDNKGRNLEITPQSSSVIEANTTVSLLRKEDKKLIYVGYFLEGSNTTVSSRKIGKKDPNTNCDTNKYKKVGAKSTTAYIQASLIAPALVLNFGDSETEKFLEIYKSSLLCKGFDQNEVDIIEKHIKEQVELGKDLLTIVTGEGLKALVKPLTGGLFSDCWDVLAGGIIKREVEFESHPYQDYLVSKKVYNKEDENIPSVIMDFTNQMPNGVIIKSAKEDENTGKWEIELDVYNSLPIPFGIRLGTIKEGKIVPEPADEKLEYFISSNGISTVQQIRNGISCPGFVNNVTDTYYTLKSEGVAIRSSDFNRKTVVFNFDPKNNFIIFQGPTENNRIKLYHALELLSHLIETVLKFEEASDGVSKNDDDTKSIVLSALVEVLFKNEKVRNFYTSTNKSYEETLKVTAEALKEVLKETAKEGAKSAFKKIFDEKFDEKAGNKSKTPPKLSQAQKTDMVIKVTDFIFETINFANYGYAYTKTKKYSNLALDYELYIPRIKTAPKVSTFIGKITHNSVNTGLGINDNGRDIITKRGVCWSTSPNPTINNEVHYFKKPNENEFYEKKITKLKAKTTYYLRSFAINSIGVGYSEEKKFKTELDPNALSITSITPNTAVFGKRTEFNVIGESIPEGLYFEVEDMYRLVEYGGGTHNKRIIKGTPINSTGIKKGFIKRNREDTEVLFEFTINVSGANPLVDIDKLTITKNTTENISNLKGSGSYQVRSDDRSIVKITLDGNGGIIIKGIKAGTTKVMIYDKETEKAQTITITVKEPTTTNTLIKPILLTPVNGATGIENNKGSVLTFTPAKWTDPNNTTKIAHILYFGTNSNPPKHQLIPVGATSPNSLQTKPNTTYYWKIVPVNTVTNQEMEGTQVWSFTTTNPIGGTYTGDIEINSQEELEKFGQNKYTKFDGFLYIENCSSLEPLKTLIEIKSLRLDLNTFKTLKGLENLRKIKFLDIGGKWGHYKGQNYELESLTGLDNLEEIFSLHIWGNKKLTNFKGLTNLKKIDYLSLNYINSVDLSGFESLTTINKRLHISHSDKLESLDGLNNLVLCNTFFIGAAQENGRSWSEPNKKLKDFCALKKAIEKKPNAIFLVRNNLYNPTKEDIINGKCSK